MKFFFLLFLLLPVLVLAQDHLLITEIQTVPSDSSFIEIYNPTTSAIQLDSIYLSDYNTYYKLVENDYPINSQDFLVRFPGGESIPAKSAVIVAINGAAYELKYNSLPTYEILSTSAAMDMVSLYSGSTPKLSEHEMLVMFYWDGNSDLVKDIDYFAWGLFNASFVDKSNVRIDGPDNGTDSTQYFPDTPVISQLSLDALSNTTMSVQRTGILEGSETLTGGNGITGHDETSEDWLNQIAISFPTPGIVQEVPGDGTGLVSVSPDTVEITTATNLQFTFTGTDTFVLNQIQISVPSSWIWSAQLNDVSVSGTGFSGANISINGNDILIENTTVSAAISGTLDIQNMTSPAQSENSIFLTKTAVTGGNLTEINQSPVVIVWTVLTIADIQNDPNLIGQVVTVEGVVTLGAGITTTTWTSAYVQDGSGRGINIYQSGVIDPDLIRKKLVRITGTVGDHDGVTQIENYSIQVVGTDQLLPETTKLSTFGATNLDYEGTYIEAKGIIVDKYSGGGGTTISIDDGSGSIDFRAWDSAGLTLGSFNLGDTVAIKGVMSIYETNAQILLAYQDEIELTTIVVSGDGSGIVTVSPDTVAISDSLDIVFTVTGNNPDTVTTMTLEIPNDWTWSGNFNLSGSLSGAVSTVNGNTLTVSSAELKNNDEGQIEVLGMKAPGQSKYSIFGFSTATENGTLTSVAQPPMIIVIGAAGTGLVTVSPDSVGLDTLNNLSFIFKGNSISTVNRVELTIPSEWSWSGLTADIVRSEPPFSSSDVSVSGNVISITDVTLENNEEGTITINGLTSPAVDTVSQFNVKTGDPSELLSVLDQPLVMTGEGTQISSIPIELIQTDSTWIGEIVTLKGVVTIGSGILRSDFTDAYMQDTSGYGLNVYRGGSVLDPNLKRGNLLLITGEIDEFNGKTEIKNYLLTILRKNSPVPAIRELSTSEAAKATDLEGTFVKVSGAVNDKYSDSKGTNILVDDGSGEVTLRIWNTAQLDLAGFQKEDGIIAMGIMGEYNNAGQIVIGYQHDLQHIVLPRSPVFLEVPPKPFIPDRGEILYIKYSAGSEDTHTTMRIYDLSGRLVKTLFDEGGNSFEKLTNWDGRDRVDDMVPLGAYILHFEVVNESSGKSWQKVAPIVVGTVLR